jgi:hypothetical protein
MPIHAGVSLILAFSQREKEQDSWTFAKFSIVCTKAILPYQHKKGRVKKPSLCEI